MNNLEGTITEINTEGSLSSILINVGGISFCTRLFNNPSHNYKINDKVSLFFSESSVIVGMGMTHHVTIENKIAGVILKIEMGSILSKINIQTAISILNVILTSESIKQLNLHVGDEVSAMISASEIMISK